MRVVLDANVFVSAAISADGAPARLVAHWLSGELDVVACPALLEELRVALARPRIAEHLTREDAVDILAAVGELTELVEDPIEAPPVRSRDPRDDYLIALAAREGTLLVTGDTHLLELAPRAPVLTPRELLDRL